MMQKITALQIQVEQSVYAEDGKLASRINATLVVFENDIRADVLEWLREQMAKRGA
jgi:hypothetical protein